MRAGRGARRLAVEHILDSALRELGLPAAIRSEVVARRIKGRSDDECSERAKFVEVEITESFGAFFVDLVGDKERAYRCGACGETFDLKDQAPAGAPDKPAQPAKSAAELAELKKRMGR